MRTESDSLGYYELPLNALYGIHTLRAHDNFKISRIQVCDFPELVRALAMVKKAAARANCSLGILARKKALAIEEACDELVADQHHTSFIVDMLQGRAGTSTNMNANEVIANLALAKLG